LSIKVDKLKKNVDKSRQKIYKEEENKSELNSLKYYEGIYSLDFFNMTYKMANLLDKSELITLSMKEKHPLKSEIIFPKLGDTILKLYISPRS